VTERNIDSVVENRALVSAGPATLAYLAHPEFQPEADTGRTIFSENPVTPATVWKKLCQGMGLELDGSAYIGGHPDCNQGTTLLVDQRGGSLSPSLA
jgi:hypothetical protein